MAITYTPIATYTVSGSSTTSYTFSSIPSTYTDLVLISNCASSNGSDSLFFRVNGDTGTNYSFTYLYGQGTSAVSNRITNAAYGSAGYYVVPATGFDFVSIFNLQNYANTTTYKTAICRANSTGSTYPGAEASVSLWRSTAAVNSITLLLLTGNFVSGSTFTLYGIKAA